MYISRCPDECPLLAEAGPVGYGVFLVVILVFKASEKSASFRMKSTEGRGLKMHRVIHDRNGKGWEVTPCLRTVSTQPVPSLTDVH